MCLHRFHTKIVFSQLQQLSTTNYLFITRKQSLSLPGGSAGPACEDAAMLTRIAHVFASIWVSALLWHGGWRGWASLPCRAHQGTPQLTSCLGHELLKGQAWLPLKNFLDLGFCWRFCCMYSFKVQQNFRLNSSTNRSLKRNFKNSYGERGFNYRRT